MYLAPVKKSSLYVEVSYPSGGKIDKERLTKRVIEDLIKAKIIFKDDKILVKDINDIKYGYVIYNRRYNQTTKTILDFLGSHNIFSIGRYGSWRYMTMEEAILDGKRIAQKIVDF